MPSQHGTVSEHGTTLSEKIRSGMSSELRLQVSGRLILRHEVRNLTFFDRHPLLCYPQPDAYSREAYKQAGQPDPNGYHHRQPPLVPTPPLPLPLSLPLPSGYQYKPFLPTNNDVLNIIAIPDRSRGRRVSRPRDDCTKRRRRRDERRTELRGDETREEVGLEVDNVRGGW